MLLVGSLPSLYFFPCAIYTGQCIFHLIFISMRYVSLGELIHFSTGVSNLHRDAREENECAVDLGLLIRDM